MIAAQKELAAKVGKTKREITLNIVPDEILDEAKALAGDRIVPALLTPGKLAREAAVQRHQGRSRRQARREVRRGESHRLRHQRRLLLHPEGSRPQPDPRTAASASTAAASTIVRPISSEVGILPARPRLGPVRPRRNPGRHARHPRHRRRRAGIRLLHRRRDREEIHPALQLPELLRRRNRPHQRPGPPRNRPRRARRALHRADASARRIIPTPSASPARSWSPTAPPRWPPSAAARWR